MSLPKPLVALDVGATKVACALGLPLESGGFDLLGSSLIDYPGCPEAWLDDALLVGRTIEQALEATGVHGDFHRALVTFSHPAQTCDRVRSTVRLADEPITVRQHDLRRLEEAALHQALPVDREPVLVERLTCAGNGFDGLRDPRGMPATRISGLFSILTVPLAARRALVQSVESAGLEVSAIVPGIQALAAAVLRQAQDGRPELSRGAAAHLRQERALLIDLGGLSSTLALWADGRLQTVGTVAWGGTTWRLALARHATVTVEEALRMSLEGLHSRQPGARGMLEGQLMGLKEAAHRVLDGEPLPDRAFIGGRAAMIDGVAEWLEQATGIKTELARHPRTQRIGEVGRQLGLTSALGVLELATRNGHAAWSRPSGAFDRLVGRTRTLLAEYF